MSYELFVDGDTVKCTLDDTDLILQWTDRNETVQISDIIRTDLFDIKEDSSQALLCVNVIKRLDDYKWKRHPMKLSGDKDICQEFVSNLQQILTRITQRPKKLLVFINPVSGTQNAAKIYDDIVSPVFKLADINTTVIVSDREKHIEEAMSEYCYTSFDGIVVCGGDGSVNQCFVPLLRKTQEEAGIDYDDPNVKLKPIQIPIGHIPAGTGNVFTRVASGCVDAETAALHIVKGAYKCLRVLSLYSGNKLRGFAAIAAGLGVSAEFFKYTDEFRWLKTFRYMVVPFYFYLAKHHATYNVELTIYKQKSEPKVETNEESESTIPETIRGNLMDVLFLSPTVTNPDYHFGSKDIDTSYITLRLCTESNRFQLLRLFMNSMFRSPGSYDVPDFVKKYNVTGYKIKINSPKLNAEQTYMLLLDGEAVRIAESEWEFRLQDPVIPFFSSL